MKAALFLTCYNKIEELAAYATFLSKWPEIYNEWDVIVYCNNPTIEDPQLLEKLKGFNQARLKLLRSAQNCGWQFGSFEGLVDQYDTLKSYDVVIHTHQNVYMLQGGLVEKVIEHFHTSNAAIITSEVEAAISSDEPHQLVFTTDFFAFKPVLVSKMIFAEYKSCSTTIIAEQFLKLIVQRHSITVLICKRFFNLKFHRELDYIGLWHEHDIDRVQKFLEQGNESGVYEFDPEKDV